MISFARSSQTKADAGPREVGWQGSCECLHGSRSRESSGRTRVGSRLRGPLTFGPQPRGDGAHLVVPERGGPESGVWEPAARLGLGSLTGRAAPVHRSRVQGMVQGEAGSRVCGLWARPRGCVWGLFVKV